MNRFYFHLSLFFSNTFYLIQEQRSIFGLPMNIAWINKCRFNDIILEFQASISIVVRNSAWSNRKNWNWIIFDGKKGAKPFSPGIIPIIFHGLYFCVENIVKILSFPKIQLYFKRDRWYQKCDTFDVHFDSLYSNWIFSVIFIMIPEQKLCMCACKRFLSCSYRKQKSCFNENICLKIQRKNNNQLNAIHFQNRMIFKRDHHFKEQNDKQWQQNIIFHH